MLDILGTGFYNEVVAGFAPAHRGMAWRGMARQGNIQNPPTGGDAVPRHIFSVDFAAGSAYTMNVAVLITRHKKMLDKISFIRYNIGKRQRRKLLLGLLERAALPSGGDTFPATFHIWGTYAHYRHLG